MCERCPVCGYWVCDEDMCSLCGDLALVAGPRRAETAKPVQGEAVQNAPQGNA